MLANGLKMDLDKEKELRFGKTDLSMKVTGKVTWQMVKEGLSIQMVMFMKVSGLMTKLMEEVCTFIWTVPNMLVTGKKINNTDMV
jgi:hypothetical protein